MDRLNLDLRLVRALVWREADPRRAIAELDVVAETSASWGARIRWGHARLLQAEHFGGEGHAAWVDEAIEALSDHVPLWRRALAQRRTNE